MMSKWKYPLYALLCLAGTVGAFYKREPVWILLIFLAINFAYRAWRPRAKPAEPLSPPAPPALGVLGEYVVDGDTNFGLYVSLGGAPVFVDVKQDDLLSVRQQRAAQLFENSTVLETSLREFVSRNPRYAARRVSYIGLHNRDVDRGEVFWGPEGYTLLRDLSFLDP